jgi:succinate-semialdehyde dehydrogenase/glutarate-semialdehyde dehydrogenase
VEKLLFIDGEWKGQGLNRIDVYNPADGSVVGTVASGGKEETLDAIEAAHAAFPAWSRLTAY